MRLQTCSCSMRNPGQDYVAGPTACIAHPDVLKNIRKQISENSILSIADARIATMAGMLSIPAVGKTGFNDGVIYPPTDGGGAMLSARAGGQRPAARVSLAPPSGTLTLNCLVLLVDFSDNVGKEQPAHYQQLLFDQTNPNSMTTFYKEMSYGNLTVTGQVTDWIRAANPYGFYTDGQSGTGNNFPKNTPGLLQEILQKYCLTNSLAPFDANGDGFIDGLFLVHAGGGAEAEPNPAKRKDMIWSHKWTLPSPFTNNGVKAFAYFTAPEDGRLGVFSHEFGHFLGLPDLYDTSYRSGGIGNWCLMSGGSWNGAGNQPARMSAWCLSALGWIKPKNITAAGNLTLKALEGDKTACYRLWTKGKASKEYFLIENRQQKGRDAKLPGHGLAVWHIDETQSDNTNPLAYKVALVQADGKRDIEFNKNSGDPGDMFPGSAGVTKVDDKGVAHPHTRKNDGTTSGVALSKIKEVNGVVQVSVKV
jgi:immune inhibitor A